MCRIAGIVQKNKDLKLVEQLVQQMCTMQKNGGPDAEGLFTNAEQHVVFGHRRLALLDLSVAGKQPMQYASRYTITYNGELYNYKELKAKLISSGFTFSTCTDTEVVLAAFAKWGINAFQMFNGMFAFALFDSLENKIFLVRDASGIKPLYYAFINSSLYFASEIRALSIIPELNESNSHASIYQLAYGYLPEPITTLKNVTPLPKGTFFTLNLQTGNASLQSFSFYSFSNNITNTQIAKDAINSTLSNSVATQMVSDAPIGVFLSGGIDSAIIAQLANSQVQQKVHTLSVYFKEKKYSEKKYQDIIANNIQSTHHSILLTENDFLANFGYVLNSMDMPSCDGVNTWFISKYANEVGLKAVLSGVGADELFGGYPSFSRMQWVKQLQKLPKPVLKSATAFAPKMYDRAAYLSLHGIRGAYLFLRGHQTPNQIAKQLGTYEKDVWNIIEAMPTSFTINCHNKNKASWMEMNLYMQDQLLRDADVMSMTHGVEIRVPFLDNEVIKTAYSIHPKIKYAGKLPKGLLVNSFQNSLPNEIWNRPKMGFSFPFAEWLKKSEQLKDLAASKNVQTQMVCNSFLNNKIHWSKIMSLIVLKNKFSNTNI